MQTVTIKNPLPHVQGNAFDADGITAQVSIQPMRGSISANIYGLRPSVMRLMLLSPDCKVQMNQGVCVDADGADDPDFRIVYVQRWLGHGVAHLQFIPKAERGADA